ncbi:phosphatidylserine decarboxylase proenzyme [Fulvitalea axinellae]|uniref:phosphatidylserine decarboxylase n=1 Tax=Fulvitalea axinellae TaxID=1182444 RepID=A0AAU9CU61_9BACT|nr:phosphatidylserine decarboxylase proenzyme [Fulvitalea axinellae]
MAKAKRRLTEFIERSTGELKREKAPDARTLGFLYHSPFGKLPLALLAKRKFLSSLSGRFMDSRWSKAYISAFVKAQDVNLDEFEGEGRYKTFNDFFCRKLKPGVRPISEGIISPADGKILAFEQVETCRKFFVKGYEFDVCEFLQNDALAKKYDQSPMIIIRLAPADYHRFHFPSNGHIGKSVKVSGSYYSVSPIALDKKIEIFCENKREYSVLSTHDYGDILICEVGATLVGSVVQTYQPDSEAVKGLEKGYFRFGGSSIVLLFEKGKVTLAKDLIENSKAGLETTIRMGENIGF